MCTKIFTPIRFRVLPPWKICAQFCLKRVFYYFAAFCLCKSLSNIFVLAIFCRFLEIFSETHARTPKEKYFYVGSLEIDFHTTKFGHCSNFVYGKWRKRGKHVLQHVWFTISELHDKTFSFRAMQGTIFEEERQNLAILHKKEISNLCCLCCTKICIFSLPSTSVYRNINNVNNVM